MLKHIPHIWGDNNSMFCVVTYDVDTTDRAGRRRLRRVAQVCEDYGQRVQLSVFEIKVGKTDYTKLRGRLTKEIDPEKDSLRIYHLDENLREKIEHFGLGKPRDFEKDTLIV